MVMHPSPIRRQQLLHGRRPIRHDARKGRGLDDTGRVQEDVHTSKGVGDDNSNLKDDLQFAMLLEKGEAR